MFRVVIGVVRFLNIGVFLGYGLLFGFFEDRFLVLRITSRVSVFFVAGSGSAFKVIFFRGRRGFRRVGVF